MKTFFAIAAICLAFGGVKENHRDRLVRKMDTFKAETEVEGNPISDLKIYFPSPKKAGDDVAVVSFTYEDRELAYVYKYVNKKWNPVREEYRR